MRSRKIRRIGLSFLTLLILLILLAAWNLNSGSLSLSWRGVGWILLNPEWESGAIIWEIRPPRLLAAALLGGALSVSGFLLQTFFDNPIASPFVLGISSGARLAVSLLLVGVLGKGGMITSWMMVGSAFLGAMASMGLVLLVSRRIRQMAVLVICGVMIGDLCSAATNIVISFADDANIANLHNWSQGSFSGISWENLQVMAPVVMLAAVGAFCLAKPMGAYQLGEVYARNMGVHIRSFRFMLILLSGILSAAVAAFAGPVSFVGIAVPHLMKGLLGTARPSVMIPASFLGGGAFCLFCDRIARTIFAPEELTISTVTAVFGAPVVIWMLLKRRRGGKE